MKIAFIILTMANFVSAAEAWDYVQFGIPSELYKGSPADWRDGNSLKEWFSSGIRLQQVYSADFFKSSAPQGGWIDTIGFQTDRSWSGNVVGDTKGLQILMGVTSLSPIELKTEFAKNAVSEMLEVRSLSFSSHIDAASDGRQPLGVIVPVYLEHPFFYDPNRGNLIFDIIPSGGFGFPLDFHTEGNGEFGSVFADLGSTGYPDSGEVSRGGFVSVISMNRIPEPGVVGLAALGGAALLAASASRKETQG